MIILVREPVTGNSWKTPGLVVVVIALRGCNNYLVQAATFCTTSSLSQLSDFSLSPGPAWLAGWPAGWLEQDLHQLSLDWKPVRTTATTTASVLLHILYNISRSTAIQP